MWCPSPTQERVHLQKATAVSRLCVRYLSQVLLIASFRLEAWAQLCWDWFLPHRKPKRKPELGQKTASLIKSHQLWPVPLFPCLRPPCTLVSVVPWSSGPEKLRASTCGPSSVLWLWDKFLAPDQDIKGNTSLAKKQVPLYLVSLFCQLESSFFSFPQFSLWLRLHALCWLLSVFVFWVHSLAFLGLPHCPGPGPVHEPCTPAAWIFVIATQIEGLSLLLIVFGSLQCIAKQFETILLSLMIGILLSMLCQLLCIYSDSAQVTIHEVFFGLTLHPHRPIVKLG